MNDFLAAKIESLVTMQNIADLHMCNDCDSPVCTCECHKVDVDNEIEAKQKFENAHNLWALKMNSYHASPWYKRIFMQKPIEPKLVDFLTF